MAASEAPSISQSLSITEGMVTGIYMVVVLFAIPGNFMIISAVVRRSSLKTSMNIFLANIALADCITLVAFIPVVIDIFTAGLVIPNILIAHFIITDTCVLVTSFTLTTVIVQKYYVVISSTRRRVPRKWNYVISGVIWMVSILIATVPSELGTWYDAFSFCEYVAVLVCLQLAVPGSICAFFLIKFHFTLHESHRDLELLGSQESNHQGQGHGRSLVRNLNKNKLLALIVLLHVMFWTPMATMVSLLCHGFYFRLEAIYVTYAIALSPAAIKPFIYVVFFKHFQLGATMRSYIIHLRDRFRSTRDQAGESEILDSDSTYTVSREVELGL